MSTSTIFIKRPLNYRQSLAVLKQKYEEYSPALSFIMWMLSGVYASAQSHFNTNVTGTTLAFPIYHLLIMSLTTLLLYRGLAKQSILLMLPWISATIYSLYFIHYLGLLNILTALKRIKKLSWLPWSNLVVNIILLVIRGTLTIRIFQLCVHLWVKQKLKEMKAP